MFLLYNPNKLGKKVGDCTVRALTKALGVSWNTAYNLMTEKGFDMADMPSSNAVWGAVLKDHGFERFTIPNECPDCYTVKDFVHDHRVGTYVLGTGTHTCCIVDGILYDAWNSEEECPIYYWKKVR